MILVQWEYSLLFRNRHCTLRGKSKSLAENSRIAECLFRERKQVAPELAVGVHMVRGQNSKGSEAPGVASVEPLCFYVLSCILKNVEWEDLGEWH